MQVEETAAERRPQVSVVLLNFNGGRWLDGCLDALLRTRKSSLEIIAVDNASRDGSREILERRCRGAPFAASLLLNENRGYAGGHNAGARQARGEYLAFLNATVEVEPDWLDGLGVLTRDPSVGMVQPMVLDADSPDRVLSMGCVISGSGQLDVVGRNRLLGSGSFAAPMSFEVSSVLGAAFLARRSVFEELHGFREDFFAYFEESDLCWRARLRGYKVVFDYQPERPARVRHHRHGTIPSDFDVELQFDVNRTVSMFRNLETRHAWWLASNAARVGTELARTPTRLGRYVRRSAHGVLQSGEVRRETQRTRTATDRDLFRLRAPDGLGDRALAPPDRYRA